MRLDWLFHERSLVSISGWRTEAADLARQQGREGDGRRVFPIWTHDLNIDRQTSGGETDGRRGGRAAGQRGVGNPVENIPIGRGTFRRGDGALVHRLAMIMRKGGREHHRREEHVHILKIRLPTGAYFQDVDVFLSPVMFT